ncbi:hypothetical protein BDV93DRAFT_127120 [Ceratobasidium sp. AG-I]|nr:hypothetical protein BDV93DRAFT_127120 [Ceratobasidium sp. AG-I]
MPPNPTFRSTYLSPALIMAPPKSKIICRIGHPGLSMEKMFALASFLSLAVSSLSLAMGFMRLKSVPYVLPVAWLVALFHHFVQWCMYHSSTRIYIIPNSTRYHGTEYTGNTWVIGSLSLVCLAGAYTTVASEGLIPWRGGISITTPVDLVFAGLDVIEGVSLMVLTVLRCVIPLEEDPIVMDCYCGCVVRAISVESAEEDKLTTKKSGVSAE